MTSLRREISGLRALEGEMARELDQMRTRQVRDSLPHTYGYTRVNKIFSNTHVGAYAILKNAQRTYLECGWMAIRCILRIQSRKRMPVPFTNDLHYFACLLTIRAPLT